MENVEFILKKYWPYFAIIFLVCVSIILSCYSIFKEDTEVVENTNLLADVEQEKVEEEEKEVTPLTFHVDIKGAVKTPGVYEIQEGAIISDVITLAGGLNEDAEIDNINLSKKVSDEMVIYIYNKKESNNKVVSSSPTTASETCESESYNIADCVEKSESIIVAGNVSTDGSSTNNTTDTKEESSGLININTASKEQLDTLNGIGSVKAQAIIDYRNQNGNFSKIEDILNVSGIGDTVFAKIKDYITV